MDLVKTNFDSFVFTHIPKCGGTSFRAYINDSAMQSGIEADALYIPGFNGLPNNQNFDNLNQDQLDALQNRDLKIIAAHCKFGVVREYNLSPRQPFYFVILRDPIHRFISHYNFFYHHLGYNNLQGVRLDELEPKKLQWIFDTLGNIQVKYISGAKHLRAVGMNNVLKIAKYNLQYEYGAFAILEDLDASVQQLHAKKPDWLSLSDSPFPKLNRSTQIEYSSDLVDQIRHANHLDIDLYSFAKQLPND